MKTSLLLISALILSVPAFGDISEKQIERAKTTATAQGKLIAFHFEQAYWDPNCPKCIASVDAKNELVKKAIPRKHVTLISVDAKDKVDLNKLPESIRIQAVVRPCVIVVSADCAKVIGTINGTSTKDEIKALEKKAGEALLK